MEELQNTEAMVQDQNLTSAPKTGAEQKETSESMETKEQIAPVATLGQQLAGDEATKVPTAEISAEASAATEADLPESAEENVDGTTNAPTEEELAELEARKHETEVYDAEVERILDDPTFHAIKLPGSERPVLNLTACVRDCIGLGRPAYNREHGKDQERTAKSIAEIGPQHLLIVGTLPMAEAAGIPVIPFINDLNETALYDPMSALYVLDGNGRMADLVQKPVDEWPDIFAVFPAKDSSGQVDQKGAYIGTNRNVMPWGGPDYLLVRVLGTAPHEAWEYIKDLEDNGYGYTAACVLSTLRKGNITKTQLTKSDLDEKKLFDRFDSAKTIHAQMVATFGEESDVLKTKQIPEEMVDCLNRLVEENGLEKAVPKMVEFLKSITTGQVNDITNAKKKDGLSKHAVRVTTFHNLFEAYITSHK